MNLLNCVNDLPQPFLVVDIQAPGPFCEMPFCIRVILLVTLALLWGNIQGFLVMMGVGVSHCTIEARSVSYSHCGRVKLAASKRQQIKVLQSVLISFPSMSLTVRFNRTREP